MAIGAMRRAVNAALRGTKLESQDAAAKALAVQYASLIDEAAPKASYAKALRLLEAAAVASDDPDTFDAFRKISTALSSHTVASDLGPKLLSTLLALGMAPSGRGEKGGGQGGQVPGEVDEIAKRRKQRQELQRGATAG